MITNAEQIEEDFHGCWLAHSIDKYMSYGWIMKKILSITFHFRFWQYGFKEGYMAAVGRMKTVSCGTKDANSTQQAKETPAEIPPASV